MASSRSNSNSNSNKNIHVFNMVGDEVMVFQNILSKTYEKIEFSNVLLLYYINHMMQTNGIENMNILDYFFKSSGTIQSDLLDIIKRHTRSIMIVINPHNRNMAHIFFKLGPQFNFNNFITHLAHYVKNKPVGKKLVKELVNKGILQEERRYQYSGNYPEENNSYSGVNTRKGTLKNPHRYVKENEYNENEYSENEYSENEYSENEYNGENGKNYGGYKKRGTKKSTKKVTKKVTKKSTKKVTKK